MTDTLFNDIEPKKKRRARKHDDVWEAMMAVFWEPGFKPCNAKERAHVGKLVKMARERLPKNVHKSAAITILRERVRLYKKHKSFTGLSASAEAVMNRWYDVAQAAEITLRELCKKWFGMIRQDALVLSADYDDTDRLVAWLLLQNETGELKAKRPDLEESAAAMLAGLRRTYRECEREPIRLAVQELRELA